MSQLHSIFGISLLITTVTLQLAAADLFLGTWKLDPAKSKYDPGPGPKSSTVVYSADGKATTSSNRYKRDGKEYPWTNANGTKMTISLKMTDDHHATATLKQDGEVVTSVKTTISKDGKTRTMTSTGTSADGKKFSNVAVYTKQ